MFNQVSFHCRAILSQIECIAVCVFISSTPYAIMFQCVDRISIEEIFMHFELAKVTRKYDLYMYTSGIFCCS